MKQVTPFLLVLMLFTLFSCSPIVSPSPTPTNTTSPTPTPPPTTTEPEPEPEGVYIYFVIASPTESEKVVLKNNGDVPVDISNWTLGDLNNPIAYSIPSGTTINSKDYITFIRSALGFQINDNNEELYLKDSMGTLIDTWRN